MLSNTDSTNKKYTLGTKIKLFLKWAGVVVFGILSIACFLATLVVAINFWFLLFGYPLNVLIPFLQFLAPVLTSYLWTLLGPIIPLAICAVFAFITYKIYKLKIKEEFVLVIPLMKIKEKGDSNISISKEDKKENKESNKTEININENDKDKKTGVYTGTGGIAKGKKYQNVCIPENVEAKLKEKEKVYHPREEKKEENDVHNKTNNCTNIVVKKATTIQRIIFKRRKQSGTNNQPEMNTDQAKKDKE